MRTEANPRSTAPTGAHRSALESLPMTRSVGRALARDSLSMAFDVGRTLPLGSPSSRLAIARSMPLETLLLPSSVGHMLPLETLLWACGIEEASALDTLLTTRRVELQLATTSPAGNDSLSILHRSLQSAEHPDRNQAMAPKKPAKHDALAAAGIVTPTAPTTVSPISEPLNAHAKQPVGNYESPLKKLRTIMRNRRVIDTIKDLREFTETTDLNSENGIDSIRIQARLLWITPETVRNRRFLRLYMGDHHSPEPLEGQQKDYQAFQAKDPFEANKFLITVSLLEIDENDPRLPAPGAVVSFTSFKLHFYRECCQADVKLQAIKTVSAP
ncbi:hypothetical protein PF002_g9077 [Phytophthora fragariae]|nr:hypothetical protein PF009_g17742 [Phytophthora fragariae]KAE9096915.1 hypothetical protein PF007_g16801 [Phytophthora fragariae]KAE9212397.1 hypothetical protein PF004_g15637 [Phytophthora fragariae]KAE9241789.1 hypothetical protein PF002_g9077 [Phytophthora fragariae]